MVKQIQYTYRGMNQDVTKSKHPFEFYFKANNIRILATDSQSTGSLTNELGNNLEVKIPSLNINTVTNTIHYNNKSLTYAEGSTFPEIEVQIQSGILPRSSNSQVIIGYGLSRDGILLLTTDDKGFDCVWEVEKILDNDFTLTLLYCRNLGFSSDNPIQTLFNYENEKVQKLYWIDGKAQLRFMNIKHSKANKDLENLIDVNSNTINIVGNFKISQPIIKSIGSGGNHTAGKIQYAYNLYRINSSQTKISPLSEMVSLDKGINLGGGDVNEVVGTTPIVEVSEIDSEYTHIRLYAIKYTSYNQLPSVSLLADEKINSSRIFTYYDDGGVIKDISVEEFTFLGSDPIVPKHIDSKDNILFAANISELSFDVNLDFRAYGHNSSRIGIVYDNIMQSPNNPDKVIGSPTQVSAENYNVSIDSSAVNLDYDTYKFQENGTILGGEGKYIKYSLMQTVLPIDVASKYQFFKDREIYRIGIQLYNKLGQLCPVKWIADFRAPEGNLRGNYNTLQVELKPAFYQWLNNPANFSNENEKPIGYKIVRADRTVTDRSIICQGALTQMMERTTHMVTEHSYWKQEGSRRNESPNLTKFPIPVSRGFTSNINPIIQTSHLRMMNEQDQGPYTNAAGNSEFPNEEIYSGIKEDWKRQQSWQFTKMFQMNSPDILFGEGTSFGIGLEIVIKGLVKNTRNDLHYKRIQYPSKKVLSNRDIVLNNTTNFLSDKNIHFTGLFGPSENDDVMDFTLINREYKTYLPTVNKVVRPIYGTPEITERGQGPKSYNNDGGLNYANNMQSFMTDSSDPRDGEGAITSMNSFGNKTLTIVEGLSNSSVTIDDRKSLEELFQMSGISDPDGLLLAEVRIPEKNIYLGNIYGGNSYEDKKRNTYLEIGTYKLINESSIKILSPGDTYVGIYKFARISKTDTEIYDSSTLQLTELVTYPVETTVDLKNRNDKSTFGWNAEFQPRYDEYHKYNKVYSQQPTLIQNISSDFDFKIINNFDTRIMASKVKIPGENIDSWTDFLVNEVQDLDGKYGPINGLINFNDNIFAFQDNAIAAIAINPRVQVQGSDGIGLELGRGAVLYDYNYLTTKSGSINKWGIISTNSGFYYYDALNKSWNRYTGQGIEGLSDRNGFHSFFSENVNFNDISIDNPLKKVGISMGYNSITNDVFLTVHQSGNPFTICFNEMSNSFTSFYSYIPSIYINKGFKMITTNPDNNEIWQHFKGEYNDFYGVKHDSSITFLVNPGEPDNVFNNITFKSEMYHQELDIHNETLTHIRAYNEYQSSALVPLILNSNLNRKFRMWRANIPRAQGLNNTPSLDRMRGHWIYLELKLENPNNRKMILHDLIVSYNAYN